MRSIIRNFCVLGLVLALSVSGYGQKKIAHINSNDLLLVMPERKAAEDKLQMEAKTLEKQLGDMTAEYQSKLADYNKNSATMSDLVKQTKAKELGDLQERIQNFQVSAQDELQKKEADLLQPIIEKARGAVQEVAKKNGYEYVLDSSTGLLIQAPEGDDILPLVKKHLGLQ